MSDALYLVATFLVSLAVTWWLSAGGAKYMAVDFPNRRSSHTRPTPRGGGVAVAAVSMLALAAIGRSDPSLWPAVRCLLAGGALAAAIGLLDDVRHVPLGIRLLGQFLAAGTSLALIGTVPHFAAFGITVSAGWLAWVLASLYLVWMLNLTNFMDGIDGITSVEAVTVCSCGALIASVTGFGHDWVLPAAVAVASLGFLVWNWPPARIFLGDVGSGYLGHTIGVLSLLSGAVDHERFWAWVILSGVFVVDATVTLLVRAVRAQPVHQAHRAHAYQRAAERLNGHRPVTLWVAAINVSWLLPIAVAVARRSLGVTSGVVLAYAPLVIGTYLIARSKRMRTVGGSARKAARG